MIKLVALTTWPDPEDGPVYVNPEQVVAVLPSAPDGDDFTSIMMTNGKNCFRVEEGLAEVVALLTGRPLRAADARASGQSARELRMSGGALS